MVPETYDANELRAAVGASPLADSSAGKSSSHDDDTHDDDEPRTRRRSKTILVSAAAITVGLGVAALVVLGTLNSSRHVLACEAARAVPEQGRGFPPWGTRAMSGEQWRPLKIAPETPCRSQENDDPLVLERMFLAMVLDQATALLTAREMAKPDEAEALLKQALLLTRPAEREPEPLAKQRAEHHQNIERLLGDVTYLRATARLRDAAAALGDAARQFDAAVAQHPRHVTDAAAWAAFARRLGQELHAGPAGSPPSATPAAAAAPASAAGPTAPTTGPTASTPESSELPAAPPGVALPVEPAAPASPSAPTPPPDAGAPTGGVLL